MGLREAIQCWALSEIASLETVTFSLDCPDIQARIRRLSSLRPCWDWIKLTPWWEEAGIEDFRQVLDFHRCMFTDARRSLGYVGEFNLEFQAIGSSYEEGQDTWWEWGTQVVEDYWHDRGETKKGSSLHVGTMFYLTFAEDKIRRQMYRQ